MNRVLYERIFEKAFLVNFMTTYSILFKHFMFRRFLLIEGYEGGDLGKELIFGPLIERFQTVTLKSSQVLLMNFISTWGKLL